MAGALNIARSCYLYFPSFIPFLFLAIIVYLVRLLRLVVSVINLKLVGLVLCLRQVSFNFSLKLVPGTSSGKCLWATFVRYLRYPGQDSLGRPLNCGVHVLYTSAVQDYFEW